QPGEELRGRIREQHTAFPRREHLRRSQHGDDIVVPRHRPEPAPAGLATPSNRGGSAQRSERLVGHAAGVGIGAREVDGHLDIPPRSAFDPRTLERHVGILGIGTYLPPEVRTNDWWRQHVVDAWMAQRRAAAPPPAPENPTPGMLRVMEAMAKQAFDPFQG